MRNIHHMGQKYREILYNNNRTPGGVLSKDMLTFYLQFLPVSYFYHFIFTNTKCVLRHIEVVPFLFVVVATEAMTLHT